MRIWLGLLTTLAVTACTSGPDAQPRAGDARAGYQVASDLCAGCHSIERTGDSPNPAAIPLRRVLAGYPPGWLATDLHNGRAIRFQKMPVFHFGEGHEYDLIAYLLDIQETPEN